MMSFSHDDLSGGQFLALYGALLLFAIYLGFAIPHYLRARGRDPGTIDSEQAAYLAGGSDRFFDLVVTQLLSSRLIAVNPDRKIEIIERGTGRDPAEASLLALPSPLDWSAVENALRPHVHVIRHRLVAAGLLMDRMRVATIRLCQTLPYLLLIAFGISRWRYGTALDHPTGFLTALLILTAVFAVMRWLTWEPKTQSGIAAIEEAQARAERLRRAPTADETALAVALFGTTVLVGSSWNDLHLMRTGGSGSGDAGGGGCGGGGCGGCGGCGG